MFKPKLFLKQPILIPICLLMIFEKITIRMKIFYHDLLSQNNRHFHSIVWAHFFNDMSEKGPEPLSNISYEKFKVCDLFWCVLRRVIGLVWEMYRNKRNINSHNFTVVIREYNFSIKIETTYTIIKVELSMKYLITIKPSNSKQFLHLKRLMVYWYHKYSSRKVINSNTDRFWRCTVMNWVNELILYYQCILVYFEEWAMLCSYASEHDLRPMLLQKKIKGEFVASIIQ